MLIAVVVIGDGSLQADLQPKTFDSVTWSTATWLCPVLYLHDFLIVTASEALSSINSCTPAVLVEQLSF